MESRREEEIRVCHGWVGKVCGKAVIGVWLGRSPDVHDRLGAWLLIRLESSVVEGCVENL